MVRKMPSKTGRDWVDSCLQVWLGLTCLVCAGAGVLWWPLRGRTTLAELPATLTRGALWAAAAGAVLTALVQLVRWRLERRSAERGRVVEKLQGAVQELMGEERAPRLVTVLRWWGRALPAKVMVRYPKSWDPSSGAAKRELHAAVTSSCPGRWVGTYHSRRRVIFALQPEPSPAAAARESSERRAHDLISRALQGTTSVTVTHWSADQHPAGIEARFTPSPRVASARYRGAVETAVASVFPGRWRAEWDTEHDRVMFSLRPGLPKVYPRPMHLDRPPRPVVRYAVAEDGSIRSWRLDGTAPHGLVIGPTGGGKTWCLRAMALDAISQGVIVSGCDPKRIELNGLAGLPGVQSIATAPGDIADLIAYHHQLMEHRYELIEKDPTAKDRLTPRLFIVDEFYILVMKLNRLHRSEPGPDGKLGKGDHPAIAMFWELVVLARSARIHLVVGVQRPDAEFLDGIARDSIRHRVSLSTLSQQGAMMMWGDPTIGTDMPEDVPGRAVATGPDGPSEVQVFAVPDPDPRLRGSLSEADRAMLDEIFAGATPVSPAAEVGPVQAGPAAVESVDTAQRHCPDPVQGGESLEESWGPEPGAWPLVAVDELLPGDRMVLDGSVVEVVTAELDNDDHVQIEWRRGEDSEITSLAAEERVRRAA